MVGLLRLRSIETTQIQVSGKVNSDVTRWQVSEIKRDKRKSAY